MINSIRILLVEDYPPDVDLAKREINKTTESCIYRTVLTKEEYLTALEEFKPDIVVSDYNLPQFDGLTALKLAQERGTLTPVIILTTAINEDTAVECMKRGAADYVIKEHIKRLGQAVIHCLEEKQLRIGRLRAEKALRESEEHFRSLYENATIGIYRTTPEGQLLMANPAAVRILGYHSLDELLQLNVEKTGYTSSGQRQKFRTQVEREGVITGFESDWTKKDGTIIQVRENSKAIRDENGNVLYYDGTFEDISAQRRTMEALILLSHTVKSIGECISITDLNNTVLFVNEAFLKTYGFSQEEILGKPISIVTADPTVKEKNVLQETIKGGWQGELVNRKKDGTLFPISLSTSVVYDKPGHPIGLVGVATDITEQKKLQSQILQSHKIQSIGTLAGGIAHDFNNILAIILGYTSLIKEDTSDEEKLTEDISAINQAIERGRTLVRQILTFARKTDIAFRPIDLHKILLELVSMLKQTFPKTISFVELYPKDIPKIFADRTQTHQALLNLCVNARDAMPNGGSITIKVEHKTQAQIQDRFPNANQTMYVSISVTDTGVGMDEATCQRIFDPFFTTKEKEKGTGLGLSVVYGIMQAHHGFVDVISQLGQGSTFSLLFPFQQTEDQFIDQSVKVYTGSPTRNETLLVVEDEDLLVNIICTVLEVKGYSVLVARDGIKAIEMYSQHRQEIALVLLDIGLPKMDGIEVFKNLKQIDPNVKVIFGSGFLEPSIKTRMQEAGAKGFLQKPYLPEQLLQNIHQVLNGLEPTS